MLELRRGFGLGMVTALVRIEGRPIGVIANNPTHLAGAIDSPGADKAARFMQLCDAFDLPLLFLCDTPGHHGRPRGREDRARAPRVRGMFVTGASLTVPFFTIVLRKGYGLGAQAMAGGSFKAPFFTVSWPTGEFGGMGLEGAVKLGFRNELAAIEDPASATKLFEEMVARMYEHGKARQHRVALRDRRRDRSGGVAPLDRCGARGVAAAAAAHRQEAAVRRYVVSDTGEHESPILGALLAFTYSAEPGCSPLRRQAGVASLRPMMPAMISATLISRAPFAGSPRSTIPRATVPAAPTPTQTA